jgi:isocitrate/isopropylmalate dehydrogenase
MSAPAPRVAVVGGDGIGPDVTRAGALVLARLAKQPPELVELDGSA